MKDKIKIKDLLLKIINNEKLPIRVKYQHEYYKLDETERNYYCVDDLDCAIYYLFEGDTFLYLDNEIEAEWKEEF